MNKMKTILNIILLAGAFDVMIVLYSMFVIAMGGEIVNIPFWDYQIKLVANLLS